MPDPLYRPVSSFAGKRARTRSLFTAVDLPEGGPSRASTTGSALEQGDRDTPRSHRGPFRSAGGLEAGECKTGTSAHHQLSASVAQVTASLQACDTPTPAVLVTGRRRRTAG